MALFQVSLIFILQFMFTIIHGNGRAVKNWEGLTFTVELQIFVVQKFRD